MDTDRQGAQRPGWGVVVAALGAGALAPLVYAPFGWWPLAFVAPAVLGFVLVAWPGGWVRLAYAWGLGWFAAGAFWIGHSVLFYGGGLLAAMVFCTVLALLFALIPVLTVALWRLTRPASEALALLVTLPLAWFARAPVSARGVPVAFGFAAVFVGGLVLRGVEWTEPAGDPLDAALLQGNIAQDVKWDPAYRDVTMDRYTRFTAAHWDKDVVIWPETAVPMFQDQATSEYLAPLAAEAGRHGTDVLLGIPSRDRARETVHNSVVALGTGLDVYHKRHLVPFGEYVPFRGQLGGVLDVFGAPMGDFVPGRSAAPLAAGGQPAAISICYEITFPRVVAASLPEATYLVNVSNDAWFGTTIGPHQHLQKARMRAIEFRRPLLRSTNTGITAAVERDGAVVARAEAFRPAALPARVEPRRGATPYLGWLDAPLITVAIAVLAAFGAMRIRGARRR